jgi:hypothetical protein
MSGLMGGIIRPQYAEVVKALTPVLHDLPPKLIAIDGWPGVGKTTLGRFLAWRFNVSLVETDLFLIPRQGKLVYLEHELSRIIDKRLCGGSPRPVIVEGIAILRLLAKLRHTPDFVVHVSNVLVTSAGNLAEEVTAYEATFRPRERADVAIQVEC